MRPPGVTMKIGIENNEQESHSYTKRLPAAIMFTELMQCSFPRHSINDEAVKKATRKDH